MSPIITALCWAVFLQSTVQSPLFGNCTIKCNVSVTLTGPESEPKQLTISSINYQESFVPLLSLVCDLVAKYPDIEGFDVIFLSCRKWMWSITWCDYPFYQLWWKSKPPKVIWNVIINSFIHSCSFPIWPKHTVKKSMKWLIYLACNILKLVYWIFYTWVNSVWACLVGVQGLDLYKEELGVVILWLVRDSGRQWGVTGHESIIRRPRPWDPRPEMIGDQSPPGPRSIRTQDWHPPTFQKWTEQ